METTYGEPGPGEAIILGFLLFPKFVRGRVMRERLAALR